MDAADNPLLRVAADLPTATVGSLVHCSGPCCSTGIGASADMAAGGDIPVPGNLAAVRPEDPPRVRKKTRLQQCALSPN